MRASSPKIAALAIAGLSFTALVPVPLAAESVAITIRTSDAHPVNDTRVVEVVADVARVLAAGEAHRARALPEGLAGPDRAVRAAREAGLEKGSRPWRAALEFSRTHGRTVWRLTSTTNDVPRRIEGSHLLLDARTLEVLGRERWHAILG